MNGQKKDIPVIEFLKTRVGRAVPSLLKIQSITTTARSNNSPTRVAANRKSKGDVQ
jgi:hypothetical protein